MRKFFGGLLMVIGVLLAGTAGLCSAAMFAGVETGGSQADIGAYLAMVGVFGGVPFVFGIACVIAGWVIFREKRT